MDQIYKYGSVVSIPLYNCSHQLLTSDEWSEKYGVRRPVIGVIEATYGILINMFYIPVLFVMFEKKQFSMSCYKIMALLATVDFGSISINCIITGFLAYQGAVFCSYPNLIYISGTVGKCFWYCSCLTTIILVTNRSLDLTFPSVGYVLFDEKRTFILLTFPILYGIWFLWYNPPIVFTSKFHSWFYDPMIFEGRAVEYDNFPILFNNMLVVTTTCFLYTVFCCVLLAKGRSVKAGSTSKTVSHQIVFQSTLICAVNFLTSGIYVIISYANLPLWIIVGGQFLWQLGSASPLFIYLVFNKTIRNGVKAKLGIKIMRRKNTISTIHKSSTSKYSRRSTIRSVQKISV
ncbi:Serpentine Receptor, class T [Caenorhabditis elegans]|uniref:Serpentine Receptor, class T n=1 Tax=Caenorhabditis elegans TaxID=6239 RepID=Q5FC50_CAEEL|nr:Serpentine Receptor, class T [Caenorhabditis elegans]CAI46604.1 Serpentine Receptor, class T [Caenorhabditis elegans]|eukprot:NP_001023908.1 Serpentine Receptor, class T [Caenorhabditis elegans]